MRVGPKNQRGCRRRTPRRTGRLRPTGWPHVSRSIATVRERTSRLTPAARRESLQRRLTGASLQKLRERELHRLGGGAQRGFEGRLPGQQLAEDRRQVRVFRVRERLL